jgi:predicted O-methyltransferase YrrM
VTIRAILKQSLKPGRFGVMVKKVWRRVTNRVRPGAEAELQAWLRANEVDYVAYAKSIDAALWAESEAASQTIAADATRVLATIPHQLGGGGAYPFLYFVTRLIKPEVVVETGVAAGFSSYAFLAALEANGSGKLYSSDFPYFRIPEPEKYIGIVVPAHLRPRWELLVEGDEANLPAIVQRAGPIGLFHYDSDKTVEGRAFAMAQVRGHLAKNGVVIMDDIQDNAFFRDLVATHPGEWRVFGFQGKYVGLLGTLAR